MQMFTPFFLRICNILDPFPGAFSLSMLDAFLRVFSFLPQVVFFLISPLFYLDTCIDSLGISVGSRKIAPVLPVSRTLIPDRPHCFSLSCGGGLSL